MVRILAVIISISSVFIVSAQQTGKLMIMMDPPSYIQPGTLGASATFTPGVMLNRSATNYYLSGYAQYQLDDKLSMRSDNYFYLSSGDEAAYFDGGFRSYFGVFYHLNRGALRNWDNYIGFQPGICYMAKNPYYQDGEIINTLIELEPEYRLTPSFALSIGTTYYVWKYFNFFANVSYVNSKMGGISGGPERTDEILVSAGLGFQIQTRKSK